MGFGEIILLVGGVLLPLLTILDLIKDKTIVDNKFIWGAIIIILPVVGPLAYLVYTRYNFYRKMLSTK